VYLCLNLWRYEQRQVLLLRFGYQYHYPLLFVDAKHSLKKKQYPTLML
jgi:hypothetical protein